MTAPPQVARESIEAPPFALELPGGWQAVDLDALADPSRTAGALLARPEVAGDPALSELASQLARRAVEQAGSLAFLAVLVGRDERGELVTATCSIAFIGMSAGGSLDDGSADEPGGSVRLADLGAGRSARVIDAALAAGVSQHLLCVQHGARLPGGRLGVVFTGLSPRIDAGDEFAAAFDAIAASISLDC